ncbi:hypothetical protein D9757_006127 [Collybiopsis confluens]|uniref:C2H2-type domain-containing protein n=1 Tax=Collybiopsis confluens TaxID=2823264 RepID=A0A8H5HHJ7_9AGAR|nr:hypothetical protein D9757_006127 [Collybiopsis confluens]
MHAHAELSELDLFTFPLDFETNCEDTSSAPREAFNSSLFGFLPASDWALEPIETGSSFDPFSPSLSASLDVWWCTPPNYSESPTLSFSPEWSDLSSPCTSSDESLLSPPSMMREWTAHSTPDAIQLFEASPAVHSSSLTTDSPVVVISPLTVIPSLENEVSESVLPQLLEPTCSYSASEIDELVLSPPMSLGVAREVESIPLPKYIAEALTTTPKPSTLLTPPSLRVGNSRKRQREELTYDTGRNLPRAAKKSRFYAEDPDEVVQEEGDTEYLEESDGDDVEEEMTEVQSQADFQPPPQATLKLKRRPGPPKGRFRCPLGIHGGQVCHKTYTRQADADRHRETVLKKRGHVCPVCKRGYSRLDALKRHQDSTFCGRDGEPRASERVSKSGSKPKASKVRR